MSPTDKAPDQVIFRQRNRPELLANPNAKVFVKRARILAVQQTKAFVVWTDRGPQTGKPGDWLVTNHPDDDPGSDLWSISAERMEATYEHVED